MKTAAHKKRLSNFRQQQLAARKTFYNRIKTICDKMVGPGYADLIPKSLLKEMFQKRYPPLKIRRVTPKTLSEVDARAFKRQFLELIADKEIKTLLGEKISFSWYLRDVLLLIHMVQWRVCGGFPGAVALLKAFRPYFRKGEWYEKYSKLAVEQFTIAGVCGFSFYKGLLVGQLDLMPFADPETPNMVSLSRFPLKIAHLKIEGNYRPLLQLASYNPQEGMRMVMLSPTMLGFEQQDLTDSRYPLMVQQHVFNRFEERTGLPSGLAHAILIQMVQREAFECVPRGNKVLWACRIGKHKVGYFLLSIFKGCLVVRTFLLLTNQGTPEGNRLAQLTHLQLLDTKYLGIDRLSTFLEYNIGGNPPLRALFNKAGCGALLRYADEIHHIVNEPLKSAAHVQQYLIR